MIPGEQLFGFSVFTGSLGQCVETILTLCGEHRTTQVCACLNPHSVIVAQNDPVFREAMRSADILLPDGVGIVLASRILGGCIRQRITGSDVFSAVNAALAEREGRVFLLGSNQENLNHLAWKIQCDFPGLKVAGTYAPPYREYFSGKENEEMVAQVHAAGADVLWVGMTQPKQEKWIAQNRTRLGVSVALPVGAVFDFYTGRVKRSPRVFQACGLEWLPRLLQEPRRLWRRNLHSVLFLECVLRAWAAKRMKKKQEGVDDAGD